MNKSKSIGIIVHKQWQVLHVRRDSSGCLLGVAISNSKIKILLISAYLPTGLDNFGVPAVWSHLDEGQARGFNGKPIVFTSKSGSGVMTMYFG
jgi:hypothetical protein